MCFIIILFNIYIIIDYIVVKRIFCKNPNLKLHILFLLSVVTIPMIGMNKSKRGKKNNDEVSDLNQDSLPEKQDPIERRQIRQEYRQVMQDMQGNLVIN